MWLQDADFTSMRHIVLIFLVVMAIAVIGMSIVLIALALKAVKAFKEVTATVDEFKGKVMPLLDEATALSRSGRELLEDTAPKVKIITDNLARTSVTLMETSQIAKTTVARVDTTVTDANLRAQKQVARVDDMVTAALTTTEEVVQTIVHGIRVPAQKIAEVAIQARYVAEGLFAKLKTMAGAVPFGGRRGGGPEGA